MNKTVKWILIAVAIIVAVALIIWAVKSFSKGNGAQPPSLPSGPPAGPADGIADVLGNIFNSNFWNQLFAGKKCNPNNPGFQYNGVYNPDKCGTAPGLGCDPNRPGWNLGGFMDPSC